MQAMVQVDRVDARVEHATQTVGGDRAPLSHKVSLEVTVWSNDEPEAVGAEMARRLRVGNPSTGGGEDG